MATNSKRTAGIVASTGARIRRARLAAGVHQREVAKAVGASQSTISRLELGRGERIPLGTWFEIGRFVGLELDIALRGDQPQAQTEVQRRCHLIVARHASEGGWFAWTSSIVDDPTSTTTVLERPERHEVAVLQVWDVIGRVDAALKAFDDRVDLERSRRRQEWSVSGAIVVVPTGSNHRRLVEESPSTIRSLSFRGGEWVAALGRFRVPMPSEPGMMWTDARVERLRPRLPYLDGRVRHRSRDRGKSTS